MKKLLIVLAALSALSTQAFAGTRTLYTNGRVDLPSCGGTADLDIEWNGDANLKLSGIDQCSNFDIVAGTFHTVVYDSKKIPGRNGNRSGSFTIPRRFITFGVNDVVVTIKSNSGKHYDKVHLVFLAL